MARSLELWAFVLANVGLFVVSGTLAGLSYIAYRRRGRRRSYRISTLGFGFVVLGGLVEPVYQLSARGDFVITRAELLLLQSGETSLLAIGLGFLFYSITQHGSGTGSPTTRQGSGTTEYTVELGYRHDD